MNIIIIRDHSYTESTIGRMIIDGDTMPLFTLERAWKNNEPQDSCIPVGTYKCIPHNWNDDSNFKFSKVWQVTDVPNRDAILLHSGNTYHDIHGCILVGLESGFLDSNPAVLHSREAINYLRGHVGNNEFTLTIKQA